MKSLSRLRAIQDSMARYLTAGDGAVAMHLASGRGLAAPRRLAIYSHAYAARLTEALREGHGHTAAYLGEGAFALAAEGYIADCPSSHPNLRWFGVRFPEWLARRHHARPELGELAALDAALRRAFDGADAEALTAAHLAALQPRDLERLHLRFVPTLERMRFACNTLAIWHAIDADATPPRAERLESPLEVAVWRRDWRPHFRTVGATEAEAMSLARDGIGLEALCLALEGRHPGDDPATLEGTLLQRWITDEMLRAHARAGGRGLRPHGRRTHRGDTRGRQGGRPRDRAAHGPATGRSTE